MEIELSRQACECAQRVEDVKDVEEMECESNAVAFFEIFLASYIDVNLERPHRLQWRVVAPLVLLCRRMYQHYENETRRLLSHAHWAPNCLPISMLYFCTDPAQLTRFAFAKLRHEVEKRFYLRNCVFKLCPVETETLFQCQEANSAWYQATEWLIAAHDWDEPAHRHQALGDLYVACEQAMANEKRAQENLATRFLVHRDLQWPPHVAVPHANFQHDWTDYTFLASHSVARTVLSYIDEIAGVQTKSDWDAYVTREVMRGDELLALVSEATWTPLNAHILKIIQQLHLNGGGGGLGNTLRGLLRRRDWDCCGVPEGERSNNLRQVYKEFVKTAGALSYNGNCSNMLFDALITLDQLPGLTVSLLSACDGWLGSVVRLDRNDIPNSLHDILRQLVQNRNPMGVARLMECERLVGESSLFVNRDALDCVVQAMSHTSDEALLVRLAKRIPLHVRAWSPVDTLCDWRLAILVEQYRA